MDDEYEKPLPGVSSLNRPYWEGLARHEFKLPSCHGCGHVWYPPAPWCPRCHSRDTGWTAMSGRGRVNSWTVVHVTGLRGFRGDVPYNVAEVTLDEGPRLITNLVDVEPDSIRVGMPVEIVYDDVAAELTLARFRPLAATQ